MDLIAILADAQYVLGLGKIAFAIGEDVYPFVIAAYDLIVDKKTLTDAQRADLLTKENAMRAALNADTIPADE